MVYLFAIMITITVYTSVLYQGTASYVLYWNIPQLPDGGAPRSAVKSEVHVAVHQADGDEVSTLGVVAVQQRAVGQRGAKGHLELCEGQVALGGLGPGDDRVRPQGLVEERQQQGKSFGGWWEERRWRKSALAGPKVPGVTGAFLQPCLKQG